MQMKDVFREKIFNFCDFLSFIYFQFTPFLPEKWAKLYDSNRQPIGPLYVHVVADKGFNYSPQDNCFVNQKKNHFQVTAHIAKAESAPSHPPFFVQMPDAEGSVQPINNYMLAFSGVRDEMPTSEVAINQSDTNRVPLPFSGQVYVFLENVILGDAVLYCSNFFSGDHT